MVQGIILVNLENMISISASNRAYRIGHIDSKGQKTILVLRSTYGPKVSLFVNPMEAPHQSTVPSLLASIFINRCVICCSLHIWRYDI